MTTPLPYGSWPSPFTAEWASAASPRMDGAAFVGDDVWWGQSLPAENGRTAVLRRRVPSGALPGDDPSGGDAAEVLLPAPWNARSSVHEYGGGSWAATADGRLAFVEKSDQRVWLLAPGGAEPRALTPEDAATSYGGLRITRGRLLAVREWRGEGALRRGIVEIALDGEASVRQLVGESDFVAQPALSPDGTHLAWVAWNHPDLPWDRTEVRVGRIEDGRVPSWAAVTSGTTAALQPTWATDTDLVYLDEPAGRWNLWHRVHGGDGFGAPEPIAPADADTGGPLWSLGGRWYGLLDGGRIVAVRTNGSDELVLVDAQEPGFGGDASGARASVVRIDVPATSDLCIEDVVGSRALVSGAAPGTSGLWLVDADTGAALQVVGARTETASASGPSAGIPDAWMPQTRAFTAEGPRGPVHAFVHPPTHPDHAGPADERAPYVVLVHGGPTAHVGGVADAKTVYLTSRGIGVLEVNYGGSTGYGRGYRERLRGQWGIVDVEDVVAAAVGLADAGEADRSRLAIKGGSAGGWTVLAALARTDAFAAGISRYGVADARALAEDTHDFESRYLDGMIGPLPEAEETYRERSPLTHVDGFSAPVLLLQGSEDRVVPPSQSEAIRDALAARGIPHAYRLYEGEGHGFRRAETIVDALESEVAFLGATFGFETPGIPPIALD
ncbi:prolyl oligopeptidase family serine peptidase [Microbacterium flavum]|uniref:S9 family peptidase n=1 Tax=Microbacterium flavum TaxID=415216 RepID=A0ABS5XSK8_9MICO|nr:prolyl oligopeptidase family serine peptidase [Microbacterium flavum]MBT8796927.1 S9 family peptidase [Microbacterium flavum]